MTQVVIVGAGVAGSGERATSLSSVSGLTGMDKRWARRAPASPPAARPIWRCRSPSRQVRQVRRTVVPDSGSTKVRRAQAGFEQRKRRARTWSTTARPCHGRSCSWRW